MFKLVVYTRFIGMRVLYSQELTSGSVQGIAPSRGNVQNHVQKSWFNLFSGNDLWNYTRVKEQLNSLVVVFASYSCFKNVCCFFRTLKALPCKSQEMMSSVLELRASRYHYMGQVFHLLATQFTHTRDVWMEVPQKAPTPKSSTQHSRYSDTFVYLVAGDCHPPHRMGMGEGHELWFKISE